MKIQKDKLFKELTTFHIGGAIKNYVEVSNIDEIKEVVSYAKENNLKIFIIGGGSDFLASDKEFDGLVIKYTGDSYSIDSDLITAEAGMEWDKLVEIAVEGGLQGIECLSGIPGTVGASPIQNIGAYGQELADTFYKLKAYDIENEKFVEFSKDDCHFGYRESIFKEKSHWQKYLITEVTFKLNINGKSKVSYESLHLKDNPTLQEVRSAILETRKQKLENPKEHGNAGSFFKNPIIDLDKKITMEKEYPEVKIYPFEDKFKISAGWLIEKAGWKGKEYKGASVSPKHSLILINKTGNATSSDVYELSEMIIEDVFKKFSIKLEREVQLINF